MSVDEALRNSSGIRSGSLDEVNRRTITCIAPAFPTPWIPEGGAFLKNIADVMLDEGIEVQVVAPTAIARQLRERSRKGARKAALTLNYSVVRPRLVKFTLARGWIERAGQADQRAAVQESRRARSGRVPAPGDRSVRALLAWSVRGTSLV